MGIMVYPLLWVMQDLYHQPYCLPGPGKEDRKGASAFVSQEPGDEKDPSEQIVSSSLR